VKLSLKGVENVMATTKLNVRVNRKRPESMTRQIREQLDALIDAGALAAGSLLPSERELANTLNVARNVVRGAYEQLMEAGKLRSEGRKGRSVRSGGTSSGGGKKRSASKGSKSSKGSKKTSKARKK
jgi:DNA-binding GntR family transcriptional regulator